jgi:hypothetical protein
MNVQQFRDSLHLGLGRALIYARDYDVREYREAILDACLHCYSYDAQIEGTRADYMYELVGRLPDKAFYHQAVLNSLATVGDDRDADQRFRFAARLSMDGDEHAKRVMRDSYNPGPRYGESVGVNFVDTDGIQGLIFIAEKMGAVLFAKPGEADIGWVVTRSADVFGEQTTWDALRDAGRENPNIEAYRQACEASRTASPSDDPSRFDIANMPYAELLDRVPPNKPYLLWKWGEQASDQELELAARGLIATKDPKGQLRHARIFTRRRFPLAPDVLIALAHIEEERLGMFAVKALAHIAAPSVREFAFRFVKSDYWWRGESIALLNNNFKPGDHEIVLSWFDAEVESEARHALGMDMEEFWEQHPDEATEVRMLISLYEKGPCSHCRYNAIRDLIELGALTEQMRAECAYDANNDIRDLVGKMGSVKP